MTRIATTIGTVGDRVSERVKDLERINAEAELLENVGGSRKRQEYLAKGVENVNLASRDLEDFARAMETEVSNYRSLNRGLFDLIRVSAANETNPDPARRAADLAAVSELISVMKSSREKMVSFQESADRLPPLTGKIKKAKRRTSAVIGELIAEISFSIDDAGRLLEQLGEAA